jgi:hypothetical protein
LSGDLFKKKRNQYHVDVDVTHMTRDERLKVLSEHKAKPGFVNFSTGWENQFTPNEKMFYTFWYEKETAKAKSKKQDK